ncbi:MAG: hypothetical protein M3445_03850 [Actinomycetota bacterium]|nr:hypothetical protein [Actinomycetota bacterium]
MTSQPTRPLRWPTIITLIFSVVLLGFTAFGVIAYVTDTSGDPLVGLAIIFAILAAILALLALALLGGAYAARRRFPGLAFGLAVAGAAVSGLGSLAFASLFVG